MVCNLHIITCKYIRRFLRGDRYILVDAGNLEVGKRLRLFVEPVIHAKVRLSGKKLVELLNFGRYGLKLLRRVDAEAKDIASSLLRCIEDEGDTKSRRVPNPHGSELEIGDRNVEVRGKVCVPYNANIGRVERAKVALVVRKVPDPTSLGVNLFVGEEFEFAIADDGSTKAEVAVEAGCLICPENGLNGCEETRGVLYTVGENEFILVVFKFTHDEKRLGVAPEERACIADAEIFDAVIPDR